MSVSLAPLEHAHVKVPDLNAAVHFYTTLLGLPVRGGDGLELLVLGASRTGEVVLEAGKRTMDGTRTPPLVFDIPGRLELARLWVDLRAAGHPVTAVNRGVGLVLFTEDPGGNALELRWNGVARPEAR